MVYEKMYENHDQESAQDTQQPAAGNTPASLQINDLVKVLEILDVVSKRGAIKADEFEIVGGVYARIFEFLKNTGVIQERNSDESAIAEGSTEEQESNQEG